MLQFRVLTHVTAILFLFLPVGALLAIPQELTSLAPVAVMEGEDSELLKALFERWSKQPKTLKISGAALDPSGKALPKARLTVTSNMGLRLEGVADVEGKFRFEAPGVTMPQMYVETEDGMLGGINEPARADAIGNLTQDVTLYPTQEVKFVVRDAAGEIVKGANCGAFFDSCLLARATTCAEGSVTLRVPARLPGTPGDRRDRTPSFFAFANGLGLAVEGTSATDGALAPTMTLRLSAATPVRVRIIDREKKPLGGVTVTVVDYPAMVISTRSTPPGGFGGATSFSSTRVPFSQDLRTYSMSDESGVATLNWLAPSKLSDSAGGAPVGRTASRPIAFGANHLEWGTGFTSLDPATGAAEVSCVIYSPAKIHGRVRLPSGEPAPGIVLESRALTGNKKSIRTNDQGEFEVVAALQDADLIVSDDLWVADPIALSALVQKSADNEIEIKLREGKRVKFHVTGGTEYAPIDNHEIHISSAKFQRTIHTNEQGRAEATLDRGVYSIYSLVSEPLSRMGSAEIRLLVKDQAEIEVPIHVERLKPRTISVTVLRPDGVTPAVNAKVEVLTPYTESAPVEGSAASLGGMMGSRTGSGGLPPGFEGGGSGRGGSGGFAPSRFGGGGAAPTPTGPDRPPLRQVTVHATSTDAAGKTKAFVALDAPGLLLVSGAENERALVNVDVLEDHCTVRLAKTVSAKGKLIDEATGKPLSGTEIAVQIDVSRVLPDYRRALRAIVIFGTASQRSTAVTDTDGNFEFKDLIADAVYSVQSSNRTPRAGGAPESRMMFTQPSIQGFQTAKDEVKDVGEIKVRVYMPPMPPRPRIPNDPNIQ